MWHSPTSSSGLRRFGFTVAVGLAMIGALSWYRGHTIVPVILWAISIPLVTLGALAPASLAPVERGWLALGGVLGWVNTRVILTVVLYGVIAPIGLITRLFRDPLDRQLQAERQTYWIRRSPAPVDRKSYERQF